MTAPEDLESATNALCDADPLMAAVRDELGRIERLATSDGGWAPTQPSPVIYRLYVNRATHEVISEPLVILTAVLRFCSHLLSGDLPKALFMVSTLVANPDAVPVTMTDKTRRHIAMALSEGAAPDGYERYALGVACQAVGIDADHPDAQDIMSSADFLDHPAVHAVWYTRALARDLRVWDYVRLQGEPMRCVTVGPDEPLPDDGEHGNPIGDSLMKLVATMG